MELHESVNLSSPADLGEIPPSFTLRAHVPQLEVLRHTDVFLSHGGMNSTMEAMSLAVPLVAYPQMFEQATTAKRIGDMGVGLPLTASDITAEKLRTIVEEVAQNPKY